MKWKVKTMWQQGSEHQKGNWMRTTYLTATGSGIQGAWTWITWTGMWSARQDRSLQPNLMGSVMDPWSLLQTDQGLDCLSAQMRNYRLLNTTECAEREGNEGLFYSGWISRTSSALRHIPDFERVRHIKCRKLSVRYGFGCCDRGTKDPDVLSLTCLIPSHKQLQWITFPRDLRFCAHSTCGLLQWHGGLPAITFFILLFLSLSANGKRI